MGPVFLIYQSANFEINQSFFRRPPDHFLWSHRPLLDRHQISTGSGSWLQAGLRGVQTGPEGSKNVQKGFGHSFLVNVPNFGGQFINFLTILQWEMGLKTVRAWSEEADQLAIARDEGTFWRKKSKME